MMRTHSAVLVTGASSGIGRATVEVLLARGNRVFGNVRLRADADRLERELDSPSFTPVLFDVSAEDAVRAAAARVAEALDGSTLAGLVNVAGVAEAGPLLYQSAEEFTHHLTVNVVGPFLVTQAFAPLLGAVPEFTRKPGRIVIVSSISGDLATPFLGAYAASKHGLQGYADSLRRELMLFGVDVVIVAPGAVRTPIWDKADAQESAYEDTAYAAPFQQFRRYMIENGRKGLDPADVAERIADALSVRKPAAFQPVVRRRFSGWTIPSHLPRRVFDRMLAKNIGLTRTD